MDSQKFQILPDVNYIGIQVYEPIWKYKEHRSQSIELSFIESGNINIPTENGEIINAQKGDVFILPSKTWHRDDFDENSEFKTVTVHFEWDAEAYFFKTISNKMIAGLKKETKLQISEIIYHLAKSLKNDQSVDFQLNNTRLLTILQLIVRDAYYAERTTYDHEEEEKKVKRIKIMEQAKAYVDKHYDECLGVEDIAKALNISSHYLSHIFSEENQLSLYAYLISVRMDKAKQMLINGEMNVSEVAYTLGYTDSSYFSKYFKRYFGESPSHYYKKNN